MFIIDWNMPLLGHSLALYVLQTPPRKISLDPLWLHMGVALLLDLQMMTIKDCNLVSAMHLNIKCSFYELK